MKVYISGQITNKPDYKKHFDMVQKYLEEQGHAVMNPACLLNGFEYDEYMHVCYAMLDVCDAIYMLEGWGESKGANLEYGYAAKNNKLVYCDEGR